jgi:uncharacterized protein
VKVVLDSNVLLAGAGTHGLCEALLLACFRDHTVVLSEHILGEVHRHYMRKFKGTAAHADAVVAAFRRHAHIVEPAAVVEQALGDPQDLPVLGTLAAGNADCLVTGDQDLLQLKAFRGAPILSPRVFYDRFLQ